MSRSPAEQASRHHSTLNAFAAITALLEGGLFYDPDEHDTIQKIERLCKAARQRQLRKYDAAINGAQ